MPGWSTSASILSRASTQLMDWRRATRSRGTFSSGPAGGAAGSGSADAHTAPKHTTSYRERRAADWPEHAKILTYVAYFNGKGLSATIHRGIIQLVTGVLASMPTIQKAEKTRTLALTIDVDLLNQFGDGFLDFHQVHEAQIGLSQRRRAL